MSDKNSRKILCLDGRVGLAYVGMFHQIGMVAMVCEGEYLKLLGVKESEIKGGGMELFACQEFTRGKIVTIYFGEVVD